MLKLVLIALLKKVLIIFMLIIENVNSVILREFSNDTIITKMSYCKNAEINMHVLKTWITGEEHWKKN